jgi:predicted RNA methylase
LSPGATPAFSRPSRRILSRQRIGRELASLDSDLRALVSLFLLGQPVPLGELPPPVTAVIPELADSGIAECDGSRAWLPEVALFRPFGVWLFATPVSSLVAKNYFGPESVALAMHATYRGGSRCLDLCAGPGFQGLMALARCRTATLVELLPDVARVAALNARLNGLRDRADVRCGDLYGPVAADDRFDHVVANVPFIAVPRDRSLPDGGAGGEDGFDIVRRVLASLPDHLAPGGSAHIVAFPLYGDRGLLVRDELAEWARQAGCSVAVTVTAKLPLSAESAYVRITAEAMSAYSGSAGTAEILAEVSDLYARQGAVFACPAFIRIDQGASGFRIQDLGRIGRPGPWVSSLL